MSDVIVTLNMLIDGLQNKNERLEEILSYTKAQEQLLLEESFDLKTFSNIMKNKQFRIDSITQIDEGFQPLYERIRTHIEKNPDIYKEYIKKLQALIKVGSDYNIEIQVTEQKNHTKFKLVSQGIKGDVKQYRTSKKTVNNYYSNLNKQQGAVRNNLFDSKK